MKTLFLSACVKAVQFYEFLNTNKLSVIIKYFGIWYLVFYFVIALE